MTEPQRLLFDEFAFHPGSGELFRGGAPVSLQPQPAKVLEALAGRPGELVTREEIRQLVWGEAFVDFDASLNFCIKQIRRALGDSATSPRYIETIPRRGYRFLRPVRSEAAPPATGEAALPAPAPVGILPIPAPAAAPAPASGRWTWLAGSAFLLAASVMLVLLVASRFVQPSVQGHPRLAVLPLTCGSRQAADRQVCGGVTEALTAELARDFPRDLAVIAPTSALVYQGARKDPLAAGSELAATHLLTGSVETSGGRLRVSVHLAISGGRELWHQSFEQGLADAPLLYAQLSGGVAEALGLRAPAPTAPAASTPRPSGEAYEAYLRGSYLLRQRHFDEAVQSLEKAVLLAPRLAAAHAQLARARAARRDPAGKDRDAALAEATLSSELYPRLVEAQLALGDVNFWYRIDWEHAGAAYRQAVALAPGSADAHYAYATYLAALGRHEEALAGIERARELDPASMLVNSDLAWFLYLARRYDDAVRQARSTLKLLEITRGPLPRIAEYGWAWSNYVLLYGSWKQGNEPAALKAAQDSLQEEGLGSVAAGLHSLREFWDGEPRRMVERARADDGFSSFDIARADAVAGRTAEALDALEEECRRGGEVKLFNYLAVEPAFDSLHGDPRFLRVIDCTGLPRDAPARRALQPPAGGGRRLPVAK